MIDIDDITFSKAGQQEVARYIRENHYSATCNPVGFMYKISHHESIVGGIVFSNPISQELERFIAGEGNEEQVMELNRLYTDERCSKNIESYFISKSLDRLKREKEVCRFVVAYADETEGHKGTVYQATNALYTGSSDERFSYVRDGEKLQATRSGKGNYISKSEAESRGWDVDYRDIKHRYVFPLPGRYESRQDVIDDLCCDALEYPK